MAKICLIGEGDGNQRYSRNINGSTEINARIFIGNKKVLSNLKIKRTSINAHIDFIEVLYDSFLLESIYFNTKTKEYYGHTNGSGHLEFDRSELVSSSKPRVPEKVHAADEGSPVDWDFLS